MQGSRCLGGAKIQINMRDIEHRLQCACVKWFRLQYPGLAMLLFAIPNGGARNAVTGQRLKEEGVVAGVADLFLSAPNSESHGLYIEMKTAKGVQSPSQRSFQAAVEEQGYVYAVCRSFEEFRGCMEAYIERRTLV